MDQGGVVAHAVRVGAMSLLIIACRFLAFLPGGHDPFAVTLSETALLAGLASVLFMPIGAAWLMLPSRGDRFALAALVLASILGVFFFLGIARAVGIASGLVVLALVISGVRRMAERVSRLRSAEATRFHPVPLSLLVVPAVVNLAHFALIGPATGFSRDRAMAASAELISEIEAYRARNGQYPLSLQALHHDYQPAVIGITQFHYHRHGEAYSVYFEQMAVPLGTREIVMYNKLDEHAFAAHDSDLLRWTPEQLRARRGWYAVHDAGRPHWKYFWFD